MSQFNEEYEEICRELKGEVDSLKEENIGYKFIISIALGVMWMGILFHLLKYFMN